MRVAIVTELFHPSVGGQEIRYQELAEHLVANDVETTIICIDHQGDLPKTECYKGANVVRIVSDAHYKTGKRSKVSRNPKTILRFTRQAIRYVRQSKPDAVLINQWPILPAVFGKRMKTRTVVDICEFRSGTHWDILERWMMAGGDAVSTVSHALEAIARRRTGRDTVRALPSGINVANYHDGGRDHFIFLGRLADHKHPEVAIEATLLYNKEHNANKTLVIVGDGPMREGLEAKYGQEPAIKILGFVSDEEKLDLLSRAELMLLPSEREGFPRAIAECMASGCPTITTDAPDNGGKDVLATYGCGLVVPLGAKEFADGIHRVLTDFDLYYANTVSKAPQLDWKIIVKDFIDLVRHQDCTNGN